MGDSEISVSSRWTKGWITRNSEFLKPLREKPLSAKRLGAHIVEDVQWIRYKDHRFFVSDPTMSPEPELDSEAESATTMTDCDAEDIRGCGHQKRVRVRS
jgi:hypothetical protein